MCRHMFRWPTLRVKKLAFFCQAGEGRLMPDIDEGKLLFAMSAPLVGLVAPSIGEASS